MSFLGFFLPEEERNCLIATWFGFWWFAKMAKWKLGVKCWVSFEKLNIEDREAKNK